MASAAVPPSSWTAIACSWDTVSLLEVVFGLQASLARLGEVAVARLVDLKPVKARRSAVERITRGKKMERKRVGGAQWSLKTKHNL